MGKPKKVILLNFRKFIKLKCIWSPNRSSWREKGNFRSPGNYWKDSVSDCRSKKLDQKTGNLVWPSKCLIMLVFPQRILRNSSHPKYDFKSTWEYFCNARWTWGLQFVRIETLNQGKRTFWIKNLLCKKFIVCMIGSKIFPQFLKIFPDWLSVLKVSVPFPTD